MTNLLIALLSARATQEDAAADSGTEEATEVSLTMVQNWIEQGKTWITDNGPGLAVKAVLFIVILLAFKILGGVLASMVKRGMQISKLKVSDLLSNFFLNVVRKATMLAGVLIALQVVGVPIGPILAGVGVLGFVVGFALQDTLSNFASGIMILLYRPYDIGDVVTAGGVTGKVTAMSLVSTTLTTPDNQVETVPNSGIWGGVITNITANPTRRVDLTIGIGYEDDIDHAEKVLMEVVTAHPKVLQDPAPMIKLSNLGDSSVDFVVRPWTKTADYWDVFFDLTKSIKQRLDQEQISIPYPQRDIHVVSGGENLSAQAS